MSTESLPPVAKNIHLECKKCGAGRYHVVIAHKSATSAKVQCEICKSIKTYSVATKKATAAAPRKRVSVKNSEFQHQSEYETLIQSLGEAQAVTYNMKTQFKTNQKLQHPKFGLGVVKTAQSDKIEVVFPDEVRSLVHNRT